MTYLGFLRKQLTFFSIQYFHQARRRAI